MSGPRCPDPSALRPLHVTYRANSGVQRASWTCSTCLLALPDFFAQVVLHRLILMPFLVAGVRSPQGIKVALPG